MRNFVGTLGRAPGNVAAVIHGFRIIAIAVSVAAALTLAFVVSAVISRVEKLESDLGTAQAKIAELTASQIRLSASIDMADRSIKSLRSDLDRPRVRPLASVLDTAARPRQ
jgi:mannitol-specific phosphotransferase system IIBC component